MSESHLPPAAGTAIPFQMVAGAGETFVQEDQVLQRMHNGIRVLAGAYAGAWMTRIIETLRGHHEPQEELVFHRLMDHIGCDPVMLEAGSHWCYYLLWFHLASKGAGRCFAIEPDPDHLAVIESCAELLGSRRIRFLMVSTHHPHIADTVKHENG